MLLVTIRQNCCFVIIITHPIRKYAAVMIEQMLKKHHSLCFNHFNKPVRLIVELLVLVALFSVDDHEWQPLHN